MNEKLTTTDELIRSLCVDLHAVRPLPPPAWRAAGWLAIVAALATGPLWWMGDFADLSARLAAPGFQVEWSATLATGLIALLASFQLSIPGRSRAWLWAPLPPLLVWLFSCGLGCLQNGIGSVEVDCLLFIVGSGVPLSLLLWWRLRRARPLTPLPVALVGALAVAALGAFLLQFFHPFAVTVLDLLMHLAGLGLLLLFGVTIGRRALTANQ